MQDLGSNIRSDFRSGARYNKKAGKTGYQLLPILLDFLWNLCPERGNYQDYPACGAMLLTYLEFHVYALLMQKMFYFCLIILLG